MTSQKVITTLLVQWELVWFFPKKINEMFNIKQTKFLNQPSKWRMNTEWRWIQFFFEETNYKQRNNNWTFESEKRIFTKKCNLLECLKKFAALCVI